MLVKEIASMEAAMVTVELDAFSIDPDGETRLTLVAPVRRAFRAGCFLVTGGDAPKLDAVFAKDLIYGFHIRGSARR
ncbi:hypothetical protein [Rhizobium beringeri]|uniref:hypothetical protein n=1 Tax=Rhizobium beringeri TaxID=3019934 RepID=UPI0013EEF254|nr:hypothetical protein [Rhizobium beringeri]